MLTGAALCFGALEVAGALSPSFVLFCALLTCAGLWGMLFTSAVSATLQLANDAEMRGRTVIQSEAGDPLGILPHQASCSGVLAPR